MKPSRFTDKQTTLLSHVELKSFRYRLLYWILMLIMILVALTTLIPTLWMVCTAFKSTQEIYSSAAFLPKDFSLQSASEQIKNAWITLELGRSIINTLIVSVGNLFFKIIVCGLAGYVLSKFKVKGTGVVFTMVVWTMLMPGAIRTVSTYMSYISFPFIIDDKLNVATNINILDTYWPLWLGSAADSFVIILFKNNFDAISTSLVEAAQIDGCSNVKIFYKVMLPIAMPVVAYVGIQALSASWSDYFTPYIVLKDAAKMTAPAKLFMIKSDSSVTTNMYMMGLILLSIPSLLIFSFFQKYIVGGISLGAVKG